MEFASNKGDIVLDSFCGSGTTLLAAAMARQEGFTYLPDESLRICCATFMESCNEISNRIDAR